VTEFRNELSTVLGRNMIGAYLFGSIAFPDFEPGAGDIDFYVVVHRPLTNREINDLDHMHRTLAAKHDTGRKLDGFYIPLTKARKNRNPRGLVYGSHGRIHRGGVDDSWALHCEHFHRSASIRLKGPRAGSLFPTADWHSIRNGLYRQLVYARRIIDSDPWWSVLNMCRLVYSFKTGRIVISKLGAANWALRELPSKWHPLIRSAIRTYRKAGNRKDNTILRRDARKFLGFSSVQVMAYDTVWDTREPPIAHLRNRSEKRRA
jgi:Aminoglycoside adenylyltransferase, C-terminal domain